MRYTPNANRALVLDKWNVNRIHACLDVYVIVAKNQLFYYIAYVIHAHGKPMLHV